MVQYIYIYMKIICFKRKNYFLQTKYQYKKKKKNSPLKKNFFDKVLRETHDMLYHLQKRI